MKRKSRFSIKSSKKEKKNYGYGDLDLQKKLNDHEINKERTAAPRDPHTPFNNAQR